MPVIRVVPQDTTDLVLQGEQMRVAAMVSVVAQSWPMIDDPPEDLPTIRTPLIPGEQGYSPMVGGYPVPNREVLASPSDGSMVRNNAVISTPCGALIPSGMGGHIMTGLGNYATTRWFLTGVTRDSSGVALAACDVVVLETGRINVTGQPFVAGAVSDGSGNFSIEVPGNVQYTLTAYKTGSPDVAGISLRTLTPIASG